MKYKKDSRYIQKSLKSNFFSFVGELDILNDLSRVFNSDESNIQLAPKTVTVVGIQGWKNCYKFRQVRKVNTNILGTFSARGDVCPTIVYPYTMMPKDILDKIPEDFS